MKADFWNKPKTKVEEAKWQELEKQGFRVPDWVKNKTNISEKGAGGRPDLEPNFVGFAPTAGNATGMGSVPAGTWTNNKFASSRNVNDLTPEDIWGYAAFPKMFGQSFMSGSEENRRAIAQQALNMGLVKEQKGTIDVANSPELMDYWNRLQGQGSEAPSGQSSGERSSGKDGKKKAKTPPKLERVKAPPTPFQMPVMAPRPDYTTDRPAAYNYEPGLASVRQQNTVAPMPVPWYNK